MKRNARDAELTGSPLELRQQERAVYLRVLIETLAVQAIRLHAENDCAAKAPGCDTQCADIQSRQTPRWEVEMDRNYEPGRSLAQMLRAEETHPELSVRQRRVVGSLARGESVDEVALRFRLPTELVRRWMRCPRFRSALAKEQRGTHKGPSVLDDLIRDLRNRSNG